MDRDKRAELKRSLTLLAGRHADSHVVLRAGEAFAAKQLLNEHELLLAASKEFISELRQFHARTEIHPPHDVTRWQELVERILASTSASYKEDAQALRDRGHGDLE